MVSEPSCTVVCVLEFDTQPSVCLCTPGGSPLSELSWPSSLAVVAVSFSGLFTFVFLMLACLCCKKGDISFKVRSQFSLVISSIKTAPQIKGRWEINVFSGLRHLILMFYRCVIQSFFFTATYYHFSLMSPCFFPELHHAIQPVRFDLSF